MSQEETDDLREAFGLFDTDGDGVITTAELGLVMKSLGRVLSRRQLKELMAIADADGNGTLEFEELIELMEKNTVKTTFLDEMKKAFCHFDKDGNGYISPLELRKAMLRMKIKLSKVEFVLMLRRVDTDKDGQISFKEFIVMMLSDGI